MKIKTLSIFKIITLALVLSVGISFVYASWTAPGAIPPTESLNVFPINTGGQAQQKDGFFYASSGIQVGVTSLSCDSGHTGTLRWVTANTTDTSNLEVCAPSGSGFAWKALEASHNSCYTIPQIQNCDTQTSYQCNCGKNGCELCEAQSNGVQYQTKFVCPDASTVSGWSECL